jgi:hypothetical protein
VAGGRAIDNGYLVVLAETGVIGAALLIWVFGSTVRSAKREDYPFFVLLLIVNAAGFAIGGIGAIFLWGTCGLQRAAKNEMVPSIPSLREQLAGVSHPRTDAAPIAR